MIHNPSKNKEIVNSPHRLGINPITIDLQPKNRYLLRMRQNTFITIASKN